jgi:hypothetical protein
VSPPNRITKMLGNSKQEYVRASHHDRQSIRSPIMESHPNQNHVSHTKTCFSRTAQCTCMHACTRGRRSSLRLWTCSTSKTASTQVMHDGEREPPPEIRIRRPASVWRSVASAAHARDSRHCQGTITAALFNYMWGLGVKWAHWQWVCGRCPPSVALSSWDGRRSCDDHGRLDRTVLVGGFVFCPTVQLDGRRGEAGLHGTPWNFLLPSPNFIRICFSYLPSFTVFSSQ